MILTVNGSEHPLAEPCALADLVESMLGDRQACGVAVAVNRTVVRRSAWERHRLEDGDQVDIVTAVQGG
jgi:sulfur carrier protein